MAKRKSSKDVSSYQKQLRQQYQRELSRIRKAVWREKKKGLFVKAEDYVSSIKDEVKSRGSLSIKDVRALHEISPTVIRESATTVQEMNKFGAYKEDVKTWEQTRAEMDEEQLNALRETDNDEVRDGFRAENLAYDELTYRINELANVVPEVSDYLSMILKEEISTYGYDNTLANILDMPEDLVEETNHVLKYQDDEHIRTKQIAKMMRVIKGVSLTSEEMRTIEDLLRNGDSNYGNVNGEK